LALVIGWKPTAKKLPVAGGVLWCRALGAGTNEVQPRWNGRERRRAVFGVGEWFGECVNYGDAILPIEPNVKERQI
jgi:hypothetical protein